MTLPRTRPTTGRATGMPCDGAPRWTGSAAAGRCSGSVSVNRRTGTFPMRGRSQTPACAPPYWTRRWTSSTSSCAARLRSSAPAKTTSRPRSWPPTLPWRAPRPRGWEVHVPPLAQRRVARVRLRARRRCRRGAAGTRSSRTSAGGRPCSYLRAGGALAPATRTTGRSLALAVVSVRHGRQAPAQNADEEVRQVHRGEAGRQQGCASCRAGPTPRCRELPAPSCGEDRARVAEDPRQ